MFTQLTLFGLILLVAPWLPRILTPLSYSMASIALIQNINPRIISIIFVICSTLAIIVLRFIEWYIITTIQTYQKKVNYTDLLSRRVEKTKKYFEHKKTSKSRSNLKRHLSSDKGQRTLFILAVIGFMPTIPDALTVALLHKKLRFEYFILASIVGKTVQFIPFIFLGKWILVYFNL